MFWQRLAHLKGAYTLKHTTISELPVILPDNLDIFNKLVDAILAEYKNNADANVSEYEAEINRLVYELYGLSAADIGNVAKTLDSLSIQTHRSGGIMCDENSENSVLMDDEGLD